MTTFTTNDREEAYKKILEEAPAHIGYEDAVDPVACGVTVESSPPHVVDSGASVMFKELTEVQIACIYQQIFSFKPMDKLSYQFALAVLKKAQEK